VYGPARQTYFLLFYSSCASLRQFIAGLLYFLIFARLTQVNQCRRGFGLAVGFFDVFP